jgi:hypothetical protein
MNTRSGQVRIRSRCAVELVFERHSQRFVTCSVGPRQTRRWHHARAKLAYDFFPLLGVLANADEVQLVEHQARRLQFLVVTGDAVLVEDGALGKERARRLALSQHRDWSHRGHKPND